MFDMDLFIPKTWWDEINWELYRFWRFHLFFLPFALKDFDALGEMSSQNLSTNGSELAGIDKKNTPFELWESLVYQFECKIQN